MKPLQTGNTGLPPKQIQSSKALCATQRESGESGAIKSNENRRSAPIRRGDLAFTHYSRRDSVRVADSFKTIVSQVARNIQSIRERIAKAAAACGRSADEITLLAITKTFPQESISQAAAAGVQKFGENRVQEAEGKILYFRERFQLEWHLVGHLQSNKARRAAELFDVVHSLDGVKIAAKLSQASLEIGRRLSVLLQVDLGGEETKSGADPSQIREIVETVSNLKGLSLNGLMTIPPFFENPDQTRPYFASLRELRESLESEHPGCLGQQHLSMGMSHDFEAAVLEGATIVRIGMAIFGARLYD